MSQLPTVSSVVTFTIIPKNPFQIVKTLTYKLKNATIS